MDSSGNLYGTTNGGGASRDGAVFEVVKGSGTITTLASFNGTNGLFPIVSGVIMDSSGNLYGTTSQGGAFGDGTVFEVVKGSGTITTLASFNGTNGDSPHGGVIMDSSGNLYGTTSQGGAFGNGTVFEVPKGSSTITTLATFNGSNGAGPVAPLIMDSSGNLYGTAGVGGAFGDGTVFEVPKGSSTITTLATFNGSNGAGPEAPLFMDSSGNLYGTTKGGGASGHGTIFELIGAVPQPPPPVPTPGPVQTPAPVPTPPSLNVPPLLSMLDSFLGGIETVNANGTETVTDSFDGIPLIVSTYDSSGDLISVTLFGMDITFLFEFTVVPMT
jgi:uncharacterized repeat protein (TIGR03803 family)